MGIDSLCKTISIFTIVGLPEAEVKESKDRVRAALQTAQFEFPARRITVNLAPADLPKVQKTTLFGNYANYLGMGAPIWSIETS